MITSLTSHLLGWLASVLPPGIQLSSIGPGVIEAHDPSGTLLVVDIGSVIEQRTWVPAQAIPVAVSMFLSTVQDLVMEESHDQWPLSVDGRCASPKVDFSPDHL